MSLRDQKKYFEKLKRYERKFEQKELEDYKMLLKRHKDDEDLDRLSMDRLNNLFQKYHVDRAKKNYDDLFKEPEESNEND